MKFTRENCLGNDCGKAFAMALLEKSGLEIDPEDSSAVDLYTGTVNRKVKFFHGELYTDVTWKKEGFYIDFEALFDLFSDPLSPTQEECTIFNLEYGAEYIIKPEQQECNTSE